MLLDDPGLRTEKRHMAILGTWAGANLVGGTVGFALADTPEGRTFHAANATWNTVNAAIVGVAAVGIAKRNKVGPLDPDALHRRHRGLRRALAVNIGLDVVYVASGLALWAVGGESNGLDLRAVGQSLALQGGFLLGFDSAFLTSHHLRAGDVRVGPGAVSVRF